MLLLLSLDSCDRDQGWGLIEGRGPFNGIDKTTVGVFPTHPTHSCCPMQSGIFDAGIGIIYQDDCNLQDVSYTDLATRN